VKDTTRQSRRRGSDEIGREGSGPRGGVLMKTIAAIALICFLFAE